MAENVLIFSLTSLVLVLSIISGVCYFLRFPKFDSDEVKAFLQGNTSSGSPIVVGHRGTTNDAPENTLTAFKVAAESGAIGVEFDVDFTKDGHAVIIHDETVDRTTNGQGRVCDLTLESIRKLNALGEFKDRYCILYIILYYIILYYIILYYIILYYIILYIIYYIIYCIVLYYIYSIV